MKNGKMQCKDIPTVPILVELLLSIDRPHEKDPMSRARWRTHWQGEGLEDWRLPLCGVDDKLALAKMNQLAHKGLVDGCGCGCRGDWVITDKGIERLAELTGGWPEGFAPEDVTGPPL